MNIRNGSLVTALLLMISAIAVARQEDSVKVASQNPSPMFDFTRKHNRIIQKEYAGITFQIRDIFPKPVEVFIPQKSVRSKSFDLLIQFHGAAYVTEFAASKYHGHLIGATLSVGSGSKIYNDAFLDTTKFLLLLDTILEQSKARLGHHVRIGHVILSGFSAGYGAIRRIISTESNYAHVDAVLLLDGFHTAYIPDRKVLAEGGKIDSTGLLPYVKLAKDASSPRSRKRFLITHSEIFPGTFVSTTESTDYLLGQLSMKRTPVLRWGPLGMQELSDARKNHLEIQGFAGNTARDHIDHLQGLYWFLNRLMSL